MSMVEYSIDGEASQMISFVHWVNRDTRLGQAVRIYDRHRFITIVPHFNPRRSFLDCIIVHPNIGQRGDRRLPADLRMAVPDDMRRLRDICFCCSPTFVRCFDCLCL